MTEATLPDVARLTRRLTALQMRFAALQGRASELRTRHTQLAHEIALAKGRVELAPQMQEAFVYLQERAHARSVGEFEDLLSAFVADVVPDAGNIRLELGTERGAPALDILLDNGGDLENILEGNGGGLTNVVVTGLGFSALSRTGNRQLMVLDEPDCWLKAKYVPNFTKVIAEVANPRVDEEGELHPGCQTLMISHNDIDLMDEGAHIQDLRIEKDLSAFAARLGMTVEHKGEATECAYVVWVPDGAGKGHLEVRYRTDGLGDDEQNALTKGFPYIEAIGGARPWAADMPGIRWIEVANLRRHVFSRLDLSPGLNVLTGDINGGKSTLYFTALRAMAYGETDDTMIRHGADATLVRIGLEDDVVLEMVRQRKGAPKVLYRRIEKGVVTNEARPTVRGSVPDFIEQSLRISRVDELDIQLRSQKQPVFLLNEPPARRARLLSVGKESGLLQQLIEKHRKALRADREALKRDEAEYSQLGRTLLGLSPLGAMASLNDILVGLSDELNTSTSSLSKLRTVLAKLEAGHGKHQLVLHYGVQPGVCPTVPGLQDTRAMATMLARLAKNKTLATVQVSDAMPTAPELANTKDGKALYLRLRHSKALAQLAHALPTVPAMVRIEPSDALQAIVARMDKLVLEGRRHAEVFKAVTAEEQSAQGSLESLRATIGVCPLCETPLNASGKHNSCKD